MKKLLASMAAVVALTGSAAAADLPARVYTKAPAPMVEAAYNWTGFYLGAGGGYGMWNQEHRSLDPAGVPFIGTVEQTHGGRGWFGTVQIGADWQFMPRFLVGAFADYDFADIKGDFVASSFAGFVGQEKLKSAWAAGGRLGYAVFPTLLTYVAAGYTEASFSSVTLAAPPAASFFLASQKYQGFFIGTGYEYKLDLLPGLFWKTEYRYSTFDRERPAITTAAGALAGFEDSKKYVQTVRSELVYRFNWSSPVVAKY